MRVLALACLATLSGFAADSPQASSAPTSGNATRIAASVAKMQAAIEKQRAAAKLQVPGGTGFFTTGWMQTPPAGALPAAPQVEAPCEPVPADELRRLITETATRESLNPLLLRAMIERESGGRPCAVSPKGAQGMMQLMPGTASDLGVRDPFDAAQNVDAGARYIKQMLDRYDGDLRLALAAYNAGPQRVDEAKAVPAIPETQAYVAAILAQIGTIE